MPSFKFKYYCTIALLGFFLSCKYAPQVSEEIEIIKDSIDFSEFYVIGGITSSGFMDGAIYESGQATSFANLVAEQVLEVSSNDIFIQAEIGNETGSNFENFSESRFKLQYGGLNAVYPSRVTVNGIGLAEWEGSKSDLNDYSFPFMKAYQIDEPNELSTNRYFSRIDDISQSIIEEVISKNPTVVVLDLGNDDLLQFALNGAGGNEDVDLNLITDEDLIRAANFETILNATVTRLLNETSAEIYLLNTFNPLDGPFFHTLDWALELETYDIGYIGDTGTSWEDFNNLIYLFNFIDNGGKPILERRKRLNFDLDGYPDAVNRARVIEDEYLNNDVLSDGRVIPKLRQMVKGEILLYDNLPNLTIDSDLSGAQPLNDYQVITKDEINIIESRVSDFNATIEVVASSNSRVKLIDTKTIVDSAVDGNLFYDGVSYTADFSQYSIFSTDGYSLNRRGQVFIANEMIKVINESLGSNISFINPNLYKGNEIELEN